MSPRGTTAKKAAGVVIHLPSRGDAGSCRRPVPQHVPNFRRHSSKLRVFRVSLLVAAIAAGVFLMFGVAFGAFVVWLLLVALLLLTIVIADTAQESWRA